MKNTVTCLWFYASSLEHILDLTLLQIWNIGQKYKVNIPKKYLNVYICL